MSEYLKLKNSVYEGHIGLTEEYLEDVVEGGKSATFFLTEPGYEHTAGKNDFRSFITYMDGFDSKIIDLSGNAQLDANIAMLGGSETTVNVTVLEEHASKLGLKLGDRLSLVPYWEESVAHVDVVIGKMAQKKDPLDPYWNMFENVFMVSAGAKSATGTCFCIQAPIFHPDNGCCSEFDYYL
ncbi:MAG: hypothetical protein CM1200mP3_03770 [Chloroflexota bacterium]|nr:MAG: hypothetical protein CM1200mP3_03770 [Chloroflexota bacterium]